MVRFTCTSRALTDGAHQQESLPLRLNTHTHIAVTWSCKELSWTLFAYDTRCSVSNSCIFVSKDGSYTFTSIKSNIRKQRALFGVYNFISLAMTGLLISRTGEDEAGKVAAGTHFRYNGRSWKKWLSCLQRGFKVLLFLTMVSSL